MKATKGNKVYTIDQTQQERYVKEGFDILDVENSCGMAQAKPCLTTNSRRWSTRTPP